MKISILTPSYNSGKYLERAIKSVLDQGYKNWEHIVVDGGSKDDTLEIIAKYPHLIWVSEPDEGQSDAMNKAFAKSTGEIIVYLNADDYFKEGAFSVVIDSFERNSDAEMVVGDLEIASPNGNKQIVSPSVELEDILVFNNFSFPLNPVSYFYLREVQAEIGLFPLTNHLSMDYWFLLRCYQRFKIVKIDTVTGSYFIDGNNKSFDQLNSLMSLFQTWKETIKELDLNNREDIEKKVVFQFAKNLNEIQKRLENTRDELTNLKNYSEILISQNKILNNQIKKIEGQIWRKLINWIRK